MLELRTRKGPIWGDGEVCHVQQELQRILCSGQYTIPIMAGITPVPVCQHPDMRYSKHTQAHHTSELRHPLQYSILFNFPSPISLCHPQFHHHRRTQSCIIPLYPSMPWLWVNTKYSIHWVHHRLSTAYTEYCILRLQHPDKIDCPPFILRITSLPLNDGSSSCMPPSKSTVPSKLRERMKAKSTHQITMFASYLIDE